MKTLLAIVPGDVTGFDTQVRTNLFTTTPSEDFDARFNLSIPSGYKTVTIQVWLEKE